MWIPILMISAVLLLGVYAIASWQWGSETATKRLPIVVLCLIAALGIFALFRWLPAPRSDFAWSGLLLICALYIWVFLTVYSKRVAQGGDVLVDLGRLRGGLLIGIIGSAGAVLAAILSIQQMLSSSEAGMASQVRYLATAVFQVSLGMYLLFFWLRRFSIRSNGIVVPGAFIKWDKIRSYQWQEGNRSILVLNVERRLPWWPATLLAVPPEKRGAARDILERHLTARSEGNDKTG